MVSGASLWRSWTTRSSSLQIRQNIIWFDVVHHVSLILLFLSSKLMVFVQCLAVFAFHDYLYVQCLSFRRTQRKAYGTKMGRSLHGIIFHTSCVSNTESSILYLKLVLNSSIAYLTTATLLHYSVHLGHQNHRKDLLPNVLDGDTLAQRLPDVRGFAGVVLGV